MTVFHTLFNSSSHEILTRPTNQPISQSINQSTINTLFRHVAPNTLTMFVQWSLPRQSYLAFCFCLSILTHALSHLKELLHCNCCCRVFLRTTNRLTRLTVLQSGAKLFGLTISSCRVLSRSNFIPTLVCSRSRDDTISLCFSSDTSTSITVFSRFIAKPG